MINSPAIYEARLLLVYCSSLFVLLHLSLVYIYLSENNTMAWKFYQAIFSPHLALSFYFSVSLLFAYQESMITKDAALPQNFIGPLSVAIFFLPLAYLVGDNRKEG